ncbi:hypothetical protein ACQPZF_05605 [Actinosynnema sp. CS-041913]|uniref:hypothetical protein n=1 Tax=Actinosynnema sp. CS-041913 TaxID=3239917 RepID=UPI003D9184F0
MPRNRYTKVIRKSERDHLAGQERELEQLTKALCAGNDEPILPTTDDAKHERSKRRAENKKHKPKRHRDQGGQSS